MVIYNDLHPTEIDTSARDYLNVEAMDPDTHPDTTFPYFLPVTVKGFAFQDKKWSQQKSPLKPLFENRTPPVNPPMPSITELTRGPLNCVTCGDVGTSPEDVEAVFYLSSIWKDVFLGEESQQGLQRSPPVSAFLRVLEYCDGILVLTSNKIKIIDEAFKSRGQLIIHYPSLGHDVDRSGETPSLHCRRRISRLELQNFKINCMN